MLHGYCRPVALSQCLCRVDCNSPEHMLSIPPTVVDESRAQKLEAQGEHPVQIKLYVSSTS
jgi:hypothetical protein